MFRRNKVSKDAFQLELDDKELFLGDEIKGIFRVTSQLEFDIEGMWINLRCEETEGKEKATLYESDTHICQATHIPAGFEKEFPFTVKLPFIGRETFRSIHHSIDWFLDGYINVKGIDTTLTAEGSGFILVAKPKELTQEPVKEIVKEVVLIPCSYCGGLMPQTSIFCPNCGARRKG
jgi:hypothetical protein